MRALVERGGWFWRELSSRFSIRRNEGPIDTAGKVFTFASTRAAFVGQKKLYGYLKERIGTRYPAMFEDDTFVASINIAKMHVFAACLSDMTVYAVAKATAGSGLDTQERSAFARACYRQGLAENAQAAPAEADIDAWGDAFETRLAGIHWENAAATGDVFELSPKALVRWAPIAPELKRRDADIVHNSIRFAWNESCRDFRLRLDPAAVAADWAGREGR